MLRVRAMKSPFSRDERQSRQTKASYEPCDDLCRHLLDERPDSCQFMRGNLVDVFGVAVVEEIAVEQHGVIGIQLYGDHLCIACVVEAGPAIRAIPVFADTTSVIEANLCSYGKDEVASAPQIYGGEVLCLPRLARRRLPPLH